MRFAFFGYDFSVAVVERLIADGHEVAGVFSFETDNFFSFHDRLKAVAAQKSVPFTTAPAQPGDIASMMERGCACFVSAGYPTKIPPIDFDRAYGFNVHPTLLPEGRGIMPMPKLIMERPDCAGITVHKLAPKFDGGDILYQEKIEMAEDEDIETLSAKIVMRTPDIVSRIAGDIKTFWDAAQAQDWNAGSWWAAYPAEQRTFVWDKNAEEINLMVRAFGRYGMLAQFDGRRWAVFQARAWAEQHSHAPGTVTARLSRETVVAIRDGYVILKEFYPTEDQPS